MYGFPHFVHQALSSRRWPVTLVESTAWHSRPLESSTRGGRETMGNWDMEEQRECGREGGEGRGGRRMDGTCTSTTYSPTTYSPTTYSPTTYSPTTYSPTTYSPTTYSPVLASVLSHSNVDTPRFVEAMKGKCVVEIGCGSSHSACILDDGSLYTWGKGRYGRLGHNDHEPHYKPKQVYA